MDIAHLREQLTADGYTEVLERSSEPNVVLDTHHHAWDARIHVLAGEMVLEMDGHARTLKPGDGCEVPAGLPHVERYGPAGTTLLVGRRYPPA